MRKSAAVAAIIGALIIGYVVGWEAHVQYVREQITSAFQHAFPASASAEAAQPSGSFRTPVVDLKILDISTRVTESNDVWSKFAWQLTVQNNGDAAASFDAVVDFLDKDGFVIDEDNANDLGLQPHQKDTFTGFKLIEASSVSRVSKVSAKIKSQ